MTAPLPDRLLACPFCGSEPSLDERGDLFAVACKSCGARSDEYEFGAHAVREWNRRTPAAALSARVPEGDMALALEWVRTHAMFSSDPAVWAHCAAIEEAIAAYDPERSGAFSGKLSGREAVAEVYEGAFGIHYIACADPNKLPVGTKLYTTPQPGDGVVVPREPTEAMREAFLSINHAFDYEAGRLVFTGDSGQWLACYRAMIAAAPSAKGVQS